MAVFFTYPSGAGNGLDDIAFLMLDGGTLATKTIDLNGVADVA